MLKLSGTIDRIAKGFTIFYRTPYAQIVETGIPQDIPIKGDQIIHKKHKDGTPYTVILHNKRLIRIKPKLDKFTYLAPRFVVIDRIKARAGQMFVHRAIKESFKSLRNEMIFSLKMKLGSNVEIK